MPGRLDDSPIFDVGLYDDCEGRDGEEQKTSTNRYVSQTAEPGRLEGSAPSRRLIPSGSENPSGNANSLFARDDRHFDVG